MGMITKLGGLALAALLLSFSGEAGAIELRPDGAYCLTSKPIVGGHPSLERVSAHSCAYTEEESLDVGQQWSFSGGKIRNANGNCLQEVDALGGGYKLVVDACNAYRGQEFTVEGARIVTNSGNCVTFKGRNGTRGNVFIDSCGAGGSQVLNLGDFPMGGEGQIVGYP